MNGYLDITFWENRRRLQKLREFREHVVTYFDAYLSSQENREETARNSINFMLNEVQAIVYAANVHPVIEHPPLRGVEGPSRNIDLLENIFRLHIFNTGHVRVIDFLDRAIGVYDSYHIRSIWRTLNPLWWIWRIFSWVARLPFALLGTAGFNSTKAESSILGRLFKLVVLVISFVAALLSILSYLGLLEAFLEAVNSTIGNRYLPPIDSSAVL